MKEKPTRSEVFEGDNAKVLIAKLQADIKLLLMEIKSLKEENEALNSFIAHNMELLELSTTTEDQGEKIILNKEKYMLEKYMLEKYHESKTRPIKK
jgi:FtsZ-binding cell division protein ZapB